MGTRQMNDLNKILNSSQEIQDSEENDNCVVFHCGKNYCNWAMKITKGGRFLFNTKDYPNATVDDFAKDVLRVLSISFIGDYIKNNDLSHHNKWNLEISNE